jgi:septum formation protein
MIVFLRHAVKAKAGKNQSRQALRVFELRHPALPFQRARNVIYAQLVLASSSAYRRVLLERLGLPFEVISPDVDEAPLPGEQAERTALRLAEAKARAVAPRAPGKLVIGSDQVAEVDGAHIGKPGDHDTALRQLHSVRGKRVVFHTALCVCDTTSGRLQLANVPTTVHFRHFTDAQVESYLAREHPYDCAGSARIEALGIALVERVVSDDPTALIGLPLIRLVTMLQNERVNVL